MTPARLRTLRFAWVLNLDAELELASPTYHRSARTLAQLARYGGGSRTLLGPNDILVDRADADAKGRLGRAWCPTSAALALLSASGAVAEPHPDVHVLRRVNHRRFAFDLGGGLPDRHWVETRAQVEAALGNANQPWMLKRPFGFAGRGQLRAYHVLDAKQWSWVDASLRNDGLLIEPLVTPTLELSLHGFVWRDWTWELGRVCVQEVTPRGVFRDVRVCGNDEITTAERRALLERGERVARALVDAGYFGPFGVDAYRYEGHKRGGFCSLSEVNARYTMGFVTGFSRHPSTISIETR